MKLARILAAMAVLAATEPASAAPSEQSGTYREAVLCSGLLGAAAAYLGAPGRDGGDGQAEYAASLQKRWVAQAIALAPDAGRVMDDVGASSKHYAQVFAQLEQASSSQIESSLGPELDRCLNAGAELPEIK